MSLSAVNYVAEYFVQQWLTGFTARYNEVRDGRPLTRGSQSDPSVAFQRPTFRFKNLNKVKGFSQLLRRLTSTNFTHEQTQNAHVKYFESTKEAENVMSTKFAQFREQDTKLILSLHTTQFENLELSKFQFE